MKVYFISGLAADRRIFKNIRLPNEFEAVHLDWVPPLKNESLRDYAIRLSEKIDTSEKYILVGLSMGGMVAVEIANRIHPALTVVISSIPISKHLPYYFRIAARLYLHKMIPIGLMKNAAIAKRLFTTETREDKELLKTIIRASDSEFIRWSLTAILHWENEVVPEKFIHIHGSRDEILRMKYTKPTHIISKAGHMMVMNRAEEINEILREVLGGIS